MFKLPALLLSAAALTLGVAACGGSSSSSSSAAGASTSSATSSAAGTGTSSATSSSAAAAGGASSNLAIAANPSGSLSYDKKSLSAKAGKVTITMTNMSPVGHNITIQQGTNGAVLGSTPTFIGRNRMDVLAVLPTASRSAVSSPRSGVWARCSGSRSSRSSPAATASRSTLAQLTWT